MALPAATLLPILLSTSCLNNIDGPASMFADPDFGFAGINPNHQLYTMQPRFCGSRNSRNNQHSASLNNIVSELLRSLPSPANMRPSTFSIPSFGSIPTFNSPSFNSMPSSSSFNMPHQFNSVPNSVPFNSASFNAMPPMQPFQSSVFNSPLPSSTFKTASFPEVLKTAESAQKATDNTDVNIHKDNYRVTLNLHEFKPEEIDVKIVDKHIVVEAKHEEREDNQGSISRQIVRRYIIPENIIEEEISSTFSTDGVLTIEAPLKKPPTIEKNERKIKIGLTGQPAPKYTREMKKEEEKKNEEVKKENEVKKEENDVVIEEEITPIITITNADEDVQKE